MPECQAAVLVLSKYLPNSWNVAEGGDKEGGDKEGEKLDWGQTLGAMQQVELVISRTWIPSFCVPSITSKVLKNLKKDQRNIWLLQHIFYIKSLG